MRLLINTNHLRAKQTSAQPWQRTTATMAAKTENSKTDTDQNQLVELVKDLK